MRTPTVYDVLIASPGDVLEAREAVESAIHEWNAKHAKGLEVQFAPIGWERNSVPAVGSHPQDILNKQIVDQSDLVIAVFGARLGTPTPSSLSGTVEELERIAREGKSTYVYFSREPTSLDSIDPDQLKRLREYKKTLQKNALIGQFASANDLRGQIDKALTDFAYSSRPPSTSAHTELDAPSGLSNSHQLADGNRDRKACISLAGFGTIMYSADGVFPHIKFRNEGDFIARDIVIDVAVSSNFEPTSFTKQFSINEIAPQKEAEIRVQLPRFLREDSPRDQAWRFDISLSFRDGLTVRDRAIFSASLIGRDPALKPEYHRGQTRVSSLCKFVEPDEG